MFGFTWEIRALVSKSFVKEKLWLQQNIKSCTRHLRKYVQRYMKLKRSTYALDFSFWNNRKWHGQPHDIQINRKIHTDNNFASQ